MAKATILKQCKYCGQEFFARKELVKLGKANYCSNKCYGLSNIKFITRQCDYCGKEYQTKQHKLNNGVGKYCSKECSHQSRQGKIPVLCKNCGKEFYTIKSNLERNLSKYCSKECELTDKHVTIKCDTCGKEFITIKSKFIYGRKYCSKTCSGIAQRKGNRTRSQEIRRTQELKNWRKSVFERDGYTCQSCGKHGGQLNAHHIIPFSYDELLRTDIGNGITLCKQCHILEHRKQHTDIQLTIFVVNYNGN